MAELMAKALRLTGETTIDALTFDEVPVAEPGPGQVLVSVRAAGINPG